MLDRVDVEVDGAVEGGQQGTEAGDIGQPVWPRQLQSLKMREEKFLNICQLYST